MEKLTSYFNIHYSEYLSALVILIFTFIISKILSLFFEGNIKIAAKKLKRADLTRMRLVKKLVIFTIYFFGITSALYQIQAIYRLATGLFASAAIIGVIFAVAGQSILSNIFSGFLITFSRSIRLGDEVSIEDKKGTIAQITLTHTHLKLQDGSILIIPNRRLAEINIINHSLRR